MIEHNKENPKAFVQTTFISFFPLSNQLYHLENFLMPCFVFRGVDLFFTLGDDLILECLKRNFCNIQGKKIISHMVMLPHYDKCLEFPPCHSHLG